MGTPSFFGFVLIRSISRKVGVENIQLGICTVLNKKGDGSKGSRDT
ncbi:hypothetical protein QTG56_10840 [Rossellomorea sp. AcN35-11]|nr:hypothetical protein [Rossellomorea aquimaris]NMH67898.1 hypothetical protein [Bacillus sp. RO3]WJV31373.1 hypothetical protein QTG56_10840 [Rossellomorea sp. AcN35-11]